jgi:putative acetyltransferase
MESLLIERALAPTADVRRLLGELDAWLAARYRPEQRHGLDVDALFRSPVRFFLATLDGAPVGCGGVALFDAFAEVKRMYVREASRGRGVAQALLARIEAEARAAGHTCLRLETGVHQPAARRLYERAGFRECGPFGAYLAMAPGDIGASVFMEKTLTAEPSR